MEILRVERYLGLFKLYSDMSMPLKPILKSTHARCQLA